MRIIFDYQIFSLQQFGGISRYFVELATRLPEWSHEIETTVVAPFYINEYLDQAKVSKVGRKIRSFSGKHRILPILNRFASKRTIKDLQPDLIHETYYSSRGIPYACPRILTVYDMLHERFPDLFTGADRLVSNRKAKAVTRANHIITISDSTRDDLVRYLNVEPGKITVIPLASSLKKTAAEYKNNKKPYFLYVGKRDGVKNFDRLLLAFARSTVLYPDFDLLCVGGDNFSSEELHTINNLGLNDNVKHLNADDSLLASLYAGATVFVYPSLYEGFGIPLLEAMRCGCPVACSNTSCMPEVAGDAAILFDPLDYEDIRKALETIVQSQDMAYTLRKNGYEQEKKFSWDKCVEQTVMLYRRFI